MSKFDTLLEVCTDDQEGVFCLRLMLIIRRSYFVLDEYYLSKSDIPFKVETVNQNLMSCLKLGS